jgi:DNA-binding NtrC family response regulator
MREKILVIQTDPKALAGQDESLYRTYNVLIVNNSTEALEIYRTGRHTVIVFVMDGPNDRELSLLRDLRVQDDLDRPIIVITDHNSLEIEREIAAIGVFYHLLTPFEPGDLNDLVKAAFCSWNKKVHSPALFAGPGQEVDS